MVVAVLWGWVGFVVCFMAVYAVRHLVLTAGRLFGAQRTAYHELLDSAEEPLTVLIPMHNERAVAARVLGKVVSARADQSLEIVPIDDHSEDETPDIVADYASRYEAIRPLTRRSGPRGKPAGLNDAMALSSHDATLVFDADYEPSGDLINGLASAFVDPEVGAVMGRVVPQNASTNLLTRLLDLERSGGYQVDQQQRHTMALVPQYGGTVGGFRRSVMQRFGGFDVKVLAEDTDATYRLAASGWRIAYVNWAECYEEVPTALSGRFKQLRRWARGHTQVLFKRLVAVVRSPYLTRKQKLDSLLILFIYVVPPLLASGLVVNTTLFMLGEQVGLATVALALFAIAYNAFGNFAPFYQIGSAVLIDGGRQRLMLMPMLFGMYFVNTCAVTFGMFDALIDFARGRAPTWDKTKRMEEASA